MELTRASVAELIDRPVVDETGRALGRVWELEVEVEAGFEEHEVDQPAVRALLLGRRALWARLRNRPAHTEDRIAWSRVLGFDERGRVVVTGPRRAEADGR